MRTKRPRRRLPLLIVLALVCGVMALAAPATAAPLTIDLMADQGIDVGDVTVSNDGTSLTVTFALTGGWCMTESHLAVATSLAGIPHNKSGNPLPGQFSYGEGYDPCAIGDSFTIALAGIPATFGTPLVIAAHAKVRHTDDTPAAGPSWATSVVSSSQGLRLDGTPVLPVRSTPSTGLVSDYTGGAVTFFSLGFGGTFTAGFDCNVVNGDGYDLAVYEVTNGTYPAEQAAVASMDGVSWVPLGTATNAGGGAVRVTSFDLGALPYARFFRLVDTTSPALFLGPYDALSMPDGFDLDGIQGLQDCVAEYRYESAWGEGTGFPGANWAMYFGYTPAEYLFGDTVATTPWGIVNLDFEVWGDPGTVAGSTVWHRTTGAMNDWNGPVVTANIGASTATFTVRVAAGTPAGIDRCDITIYVVEGGPGVGSWQITAVVNSPGETCPFAGQVQGPWTISAGTIAAYGA